MTSSSVWQLSCQLTNGNWQQTDWRHVALHQSWPSWSVSIPQIAVASLLPNWGEQCRQSRQWLSWPSWSGSTVSGKQGQVADGGYAEHRSVAFFLHKSRWESTELKSRMRREVFQFRHCDWINEIHANLNLQLFIFICGVMAHELNQCDSCQVARIIGGGVLLLLNS